MSDQDISRPCGSHVRPYRLTNVRAPSEYRRRAPGRDRDLTVGQRWRARRDLTILVAAEAGLSQRYLADVFDLPRSRIGEILKAQRAKAGLSS